MTSNYNSWKNFKAIPYTRQEREENAEAECIERLQAEEAEAEFKAAALLSWTAGNGSEIRIYHDEKESFLVIVDGKEYPLCYMQVANEKYQAAGLVAKLGPVGLTAERKAVLESK